MPDTGCNGLHFNQSGSKLLSNDVLINRIWWWKVLRLEEENTIKNIRNLFRLKKELNYTAIRYIRNLFRLEKETKAIKDRILRDINNLFAHKEEENCYKPVTVRNLWSNNYIEYKSNGDRNKKLSAAEYLNKIRQYLKDIKNNLKKSYTWKIQLIIGITLFLP